MKVRTIVGGNSLYYVVYIHTMEVSCRSILYDIHMAQACPLGLRYDKVVLEWGRFRWISPIKIMFVRLKESTISAIVHHKLSVSKRVPLLIYH